ncbi:MAG: Uma2 family endonuclease [Acidobacteriota bacterium]|nr:Uma2 family endonuclease [Acidobacteriota bacterium]
MATTVHLITYEESLQMPENQFEEILDGESRIMPPPMPQHCLLLHALSKMLATILPGYAIFTSGLGVGIRRSPFRYRIPDLTVFDQKTFTDAVYGNRSDPYVWEAPILIAECLSPSNRRGNVEDLVRDYQSIGVPELWLFRPEARLFEGYGHSELAARLDLDELWRAFHGKQTLDQ